MPSLPPPQDDGSITPRSFPARPGIPLSALAEHISSSRYFSRNVVLPHPSPYRDTLRNLLLLEQAAHFGWLQDQVFRERLLQIAPISFGPEMQTTPLVDESEEFPSGAQQHRFSRSTTLDIEGIEAKRLKFTIVARWHSRVDDNDSPYDPCWVVERGFASRMAQHREVLLNPLPLRNAPAIPWPAVLNDEQRIAYGYDAWGHPQAASPGTPMICYRRDAVGHLWLPYAVKRRLTEALNAKTHQRAAEHLSFDAWELALGETLLPACHFPCLPSREIFGVPEREAQLNRVAMRPPIGIQRMSLADTLICRDLERLLSRAVTQGPVIPPPFAGLGHGLVLAIWKAHYAEGDLAPEFVTVIKEYVTLSRDCSELPAFLTHLVTSQSLLSATRRYALQALAKVAPESAVQLARLLSGDRSRIMQVAGAEFLAVHAPEHLPEYRRSIRAPTYSQQEILRTLPAGEAPSP